MLYGCQVSAEPTVPVPTITADHKNPTAKGDLYEKVVATILPSSTPPPTTNIPATVTPIPTKITSTPTTMPSPTAVSTPTATPIGPCDQRMPEDDLLAVVTLDYDLSRDYKPTDLVPLGDWLPMSVTLGYPSEIRREVLNPLLDMVEDMQAEGLAPRIMSAFRSYPAQAIAWNKWNQLYPEHASIISAPPGHSEHQLGTVVDFGSPELAGIVGQADIEFHTYFNKTHEGLWLADNAHKYGFTLSYPPNAFEVTGFFYEPWHYRYVGVDLAAKLRDMELTLTEYQLANQSEPCIP